MSTKKGKAGVLVLAVLCLLAGTFYQVNSPRRFVLAEMVLLLAVCLAAFFLAGKGKEEAGVFLLFGISFLLRACYIIYTPTWVRQHDVIGFGAGFGQAGLIEYYYENHKLIDFDPRTLWGFFQPPLHHILAAVWLKINTMLKVGYNHACENIQVLTLFYSMMTTVYAYRIMKEFKLTGRALLLGLGLTAMHPCFIIMAGSINNDMLCILLQVMAVYYLIRWYRDPRWGTIAVLALCVGGSMMAKLSGGLIAPAMAVVFLYRLVKDREDFGRYFGQYVLFGILCIPIGLFFPVRNLILFGVPLNYTPGVGEPVGSYSVFRRLLDIRTDSPYTHMISNGCAYDEFNIPLTLLKTSLFGEYDFRQAVSAATPFAWLALASGAVLAAAALAAIILVWKKRDSAMEFPMKVFFTLYYVVSIMFYLNFCFSMPYFSSQDFRYIAHLLVLSGVFLGLSDKECVKKRWVKTAVTGTLVVFSISSAAVYLLIGLYQWN